MWHFLFEKLFKSISFTLFPLDLSVFINGKVIISRLTLTVYINDLLIIEKYKKNIIHIKQLFKVQFEVKDLEEV